MDEAEGAPRSLLLEPGIKVQSTPGPGDEAVTYETTEAVEVRPAWNALRPQLFEDHTLDGATTRLWLAGSDLRASPGDGVFFTGADGPHFATVSRVERRAANRAADPDARDFTILHIRPLASSPLHDDSYATVTALMFPPEPAAAYFDRVIDADDLAAELTAAGHDEAEVFDVFASTPAVLPEVTLFHARAPMFGHNAQPFEVLPLALTGETPKYKIEDGEVVPDGTHVGPYKGLENAWADGDLDVLDEDDDGTLHLDGAQPALAEDTTVVLRDGDDWAVYLAEEVAETSYARFAISGKATRVRLSDTTGFGTLTIRGTTAYFAAETVPLARPPIVGAVSDGSAAPIRLQGYAPGLTSGARLAISGRRVGDGDAETRMLAEVTEVVHDFALGGATTLRFDPPLGEPFERASLRINANVASVTHGESVREILGDGDASMPFWSATLKQAPQTHVSDDSPSGTAPTLEVRINDILWERVRDFLDADTEARVYVTEVDADGKTRLTFGDGVRGARPLTGRQNVRAAYRKELGLKGRVPARALNILLSRPLGLTGAENPLPSSGGADPEPVAAIRENAPLTVRTLDRAVSATDYSDFARGYAGIAKASARLVSQGVAQLVHITVAGEEGEQVLAGSILHDRLSGAIAAASDPYRHFLLSSYRPATFRFGARLSLDPTYLVDAVLGNVEARLREAFGFEARALGAPLWKSEVIAAIHEVPGVVAVDVTSFHRDFHPDGSPAAVGNLPGLGVDDARVAVDGTAIGAELLTLHPGPLAQLTVLP